MHYQSECHHLCLTLTVEPRPSLGSSSTVASFRWLIHEYYILYKFHCSNHLFESEAALPSQNLLFFATAQFFQTREEHMNTFLFTG